MNFQQSFEALLAGILTDYKNQFPEADASQGSLIFIKSAVLSSALWGLYKYQEYIAQQIFADTAASENLEHHTFIRNIARKAGESNEDLLARYLDDIRNPPAGGNKRDYEKWALAITNVKMAYCFPLALGLGTVDVVIVADEVATGSEIPAQALLDEVAAYIDEKRPVTASTLRVLPPTAVPQNVTMTVTGDADKTQLAADTTAYMESLIPGQSLFRAQLTAIAIRNGADNVDLTVPAADVVPGNYEMLRPGVISVT